MSEQVDERDDPPRGLLGATPTFSRPNGIDDPASDEDEEDVTVPPRAIGRFLVLRRVGRGGMGEVFSAFDEGLGRRVAVKLIKGQSRARASRGARMRREAQAMARVSHPNVIQVFEVGHYLERTFIAMEYVEGQTLTQWQRAAARSHAEIIDAYLQAGAGLNAAHRAGVLHRDFKPSNALIDGEGRVRVMDFGLAAWLKRGDAIGSDGVDVAEDEAPAAPEQPALTHDGRLLGTPGFMSPEQYRGEPLDERSDQFAFCVALYDALVGTHPFGGGTIAGLRESILEGELYDGPAARALPSPLRRALWRGLSKNPRERWPDMNALLAALRPPPRRARWAWGLAAAVVSLSAGGVAYGVLVGRSGVCEGSAEQLARVWNDERRASARAGLLATGVPLADSTWHRAEQEIDDYAGEWAATRHQVCEANQVRGEQLMDRRMACLDLRLEAVSSLLSTFEDAEVETVLRAVDASARLPALVECEKVGGEAAADAEEARPEAVELRRRLVAALSHLDVGRMEEAYVELEELGAEARVRGLPRLAAEVLVQRGRAEVERGLLKEADATLEAGLWEAVARGHDEAAFAAAVRHLRLVGVTLADAERGRAGIARSEAFLLRLGDAEASRLEHLMAAGTVLGRHGDFREARARLDEALALARRLYGPHHVELGYALNATGMVALWSNDLDAAERIFGELVELDRQLYDPGHTVVASALNNLAVVMASKGDLGAAEGYFREAYETRVHALGEQHVLVADSLMNLGGVALNRGDPEGSLPHLDRARAIYGDRLGEDAAKTNDADRARGMVLIELHRDDEAEPLLRAVLARTRSIMGERHPDLVGPLETLGTLLTRPRDAAEAVALLEEAVELRRESVKQSGVPREQVEPLTELEAKLERAQRVLRGDL
jgi:tetratricopeptide (TPR) repeat protein/predicted Ser/Thr protein kinase